MDEDIKYWLRLADSDLTSAEILHRAGEELNAIFHLQQAVEKTLKALYIRQRSTMPPRLHDLPRLAAACELQVTGEQIRLLKDLTESYSDSRYPEDWPDNPPAISSDRMEALVVESKDFIAWLRQKL
jgi:HEPN domain-containing protein